MNDKCPQYVMDFIEAVYPGNAELALASFNETVALQDATGLISELRQAWEVVSEQNDENHQPAANYELLLARLAGKPTNHGDEPVAAYIDKIERERDEAVADNAAMTKAIIAVQQLLTQYLVPDGRDADDILGEILGILDREPFITMQNPGRALLARLEAAEAIVAALQPADYYAGDACTESEYKYIRRPAYEQLMKAVDAAKGDKT